VLGHEVGLGLSADQTVGSVYLDTGERGGAEPPTGEVVFGTTTHNIFGKGPEGLEFGQEEGDGALGGGSVFMSKEGVQELKEACDELAH